MSNYQEGALSQEMDDEKPAPTITTLDGGWNLDHVATMTIEGAANALWQDAERKLLHEATAALVYHDAQSLAGALAEVVREADAEAARQTEAHTAGLVESERLRKAWRAASDKVATCKPAQRGKLDAKVKAARDAHLDAEQGWQTARKLAHEAGKRAGTLRQLAQGLADIERPTLTAWPVVLGAW